MMFLHHVGDAIRSAFLAVPLPVARGLFLVTLLALLLWVVFLPKSAGRRDPDSPWSQDLRVWAAVAILIQVLIYSVF